MEEKSMMFENTHYVVRPYTSDDNAGLAVMWNESDDQWPGTFTRGVPFTEERVRKWMEHEVCLMCLVVEDTSDGAIVGFGTLWENPARKDSCYVATLNVHPAHQKRSLARRMLTQMVDWATEHGYQRVTINTWPANLKSVPLYKKVGFVWVPEMNVFMENYIPMIRQLDLAQDFFSRHNWYTAFQRELSQKEDDERHPATGEMKVFVFRWEEDGEFLEVVIDRYAQTITGIETADIAAYAVVDESEPAQGFSSPIRWQITNKQDHPMQISILAEGEKGIALNHHASFALEGGESHDIEATFICAADAERLKLNERNRNKTAPKIKTMLVVGSQTSSGVQQQMMELGTGVRYRPAVDISLDTRFPSLLPGKEQTIHVVLRNRTGRRIRGMVSIVPQEGLRTDWMRHDFEIEPEHYAGLPLKVTCDHAGAMLFTAHAAITSEDDAIAIAPKQFPLLTTPLGEVNACMNPDDEYAIAENDLFQFTCHARGGFCRIYNKALKRGEVMALEELGPPFQPMDLREKDYQITLESGRGWAKITVTITSGRFPGLQLVRNITVTASPALRIEYRLVNNGEIPHDVQVRTYVGFSNFDREIGMAALPRTDRLITTRAIEFPSTHGDLPEEPEKMAEQWMAVSREGQAAGVIWGQEIVKHEAWWQWMGLSFARHTIDLQQIVMTEPLHLYVGPGDWRDVRRFWQRLTGNPIQYIEALPETQKPHSFHLNPTPLIASGNEVQAQLCLDSARLQSLNGCLLIEPPQDWNVDQTEVAVSEVNLEKPLSVPLRFTTTHDGIGAFGGQLRLESQLRNEIEPFTILRLGDDSTSVTVTQQKQAEQPVWILKNGRHAWTIAPDFHAGIIAWNDGDVKDGESSPNHLMTSFPDDGNLGWLRPWFGGIRPSFFVGDDAHIWPGRLQDEVFTTKPYEETAANGLTWQGVQLASVLTREQCQGVRIELCYLTLGASNVLKLVFRVMNESSAPRRATPGFLTFTQLDGDHAQSVLYADNVQRKRMTEMAWTRVGSWGAVVNPETQRAMVMISGCGDTLMGVMDWGKDGGHFWYDDELTVPPFESRELVGYLALTESLEQARQYEALKHLG